MKNQTKIQNIKKIFKRLKDQSGSHSPSIKTVLNEIPEIKIKIDACFLSNPYATNLFLDYLKKDFPAIHDLRDCLEFYPPQNIDIAKSIGKTLNISHKNIFVGNGAIEIISAALKNFCSKRILLPIPTFSSYYEFLNDNQQMFYHQLKESNNYEIDVNKLKEDVFNNKVDSLILINPNNPNGGFLNLKKLLTILDYSKNLDCVILDESFVHFAYENDQLELPNYYKLIEHYPNLIIIKSMSKDFGIAGIRAGYGIMKEERVSNLLNSGYLWNISGLAAYFFELYSSVEFREKYEIVRKKYIMNTLMFSSELNNINGIKIYSSKANFFLVKVNEDNEGDFGIKLLVNHGVYIRNCSDKIGLEGSGYYRLASRTFEENMNIIKAIKSELH